ncbi:MAG TPA: TetR/AcrR family transcriptional regulator C-terminal domain-containing protein [Actinomycetota bacterium]|nr:TetR/AcrR family transcriptional regulator C-terminal domain-containing protein [Actinomycetota bacterium]
MATKIEETARPREPLTKERILRTAVALADEGGVESLGMRRIAQELGVVPMALYKHVENKDELLDGMVDVVVGEIDRPIEGADWKTTMRERILSARRALLRHPWASRVLESRGEPTPIVIGYMDSMMGVFLDGGFSVDLMHHAMHVMGSRILGFSQELFDDAASMPAEEAAAMWTQMADAYPNIAKLIPVAVDSHEGPVVGGGCDDQFEFEFALDLVLDGLDRLRERETRADAATSAHGSY